MVLFEMCFPSELAMMTKRVQPVIGRKRSQPLKSLFDSKWSPSTLNQEIIRGWRPSLTPMLRKHYAGVANLVEQCWSNDPSRRPRASELEDKLYDAFNQISKDIRKHVENFGSASLGLDLIDFDWHVIQNMRTCLKEVQVNGTLFTQPVVPLTSEEAKGIKVRKVGNYSEFAMGPFPLACSAAEALSLYPEVTNIEVKGGIYTKGKEASEVSGTPIKSQWDSRLTEASFARARRYAPPARVERRRLLNTFLFLQPSERTVSDSRGL